MRHRHHVNPLKSVYLERARPPLRLPPTETEIEVEIGCADARFLFERAAADPSLFCVGLEIRRDLVDDVNQRAAAAGLANLSAVFANANTDLAHLFPDGRLARVFVNFPDPWFKRRHHKRRLLTPELAATVVDKLAPGGVLFFQSDVFELALDAMALLEDTRRLDNERGPWSFASGNPFGARSLREERAADKQLPVWRLAYRRRC